MSNSDCCGADRWNDTDICNDCREHADFTEEDFICGSCGEFCNEYTYNKKTDVDECNKCKI